MHCLKLIAVIFAGRAALVFYKVTLEDGKTAKHSHECAAEQCALVFISFIAPIVTFRTG